MDLLRSCYETTMRFGPGPDDTVKVRWFKVHPTAKPLPFPTKFFSRNWLADKDTVNPVGEVKGAARPYRFCQCCVSRKAPGEPFGAPETWLEGAKPGTPLQRGPLSDCAEAKQKIGVRLRVTVKTADPKKEPKEGVKVPANVPPRPAVRPDGKPGAAVPGVVPPRPPLLPAARPAPKLPAVVPPRPPVVPDLKPGIKMPGLVPVPTVPGEPKPGAKITGTVTGSSSGLGVTETPVVRMPAIVRPAPTMSLARAVGPSLSGSLTRSPVDSPLSPSAAGLTATVPDLPALTTSAAEAGGVSLGGSVTRPAVDAAAGQGGASLASTVPQLPALSPSEAWGLALASLLPGPLAQVVPHVGTGLTGIMAYPGSVAVSASAAAKLSASVTRAAVASATVAAAKLPADVTGPDALTTEAGEAGVSMEATVTYTPAPSGGSDTFTTSGTWTCPAGVTSVLVECWGGGGRGGNSTPLGGRRSGSGGGGGAYAASTVSVTPGTGYTVVVGDAGQAIVDGGDSSFGAGPSVLAKGGKGGGTTTPGAGGLASASVGTTTRDGGTGGTGGTGTGPGAGGGSSAGTSAAGNTGTSAAAGGAGGTAPAGGGAGGAGGAAGSPGNAGSVPGGGGGGAGITTSVQLGAGGAPGKVVISW